MKNLSLKAFAVIIFLVLLLPCAKAEAALTESQIQSIISLLQAFGVNSSTVADVNSILRGTKMPVPAPVITPGINPQNNYYLVINDPAANAVWNNGVSYQVKWSGKANGASKLGIELYRKSNPSKSVATISSSVYTVNQSFVWKIPSSIPPANDYQVKITSASDKTVFAYSGVFSIAARVDQTIPSVSVSSPGSGNNWSTGNNYAIFWSTSQNAGSSVKIDLYKAGIFVQTISSSTANNGSYYWTVPKTIVDGNDYQIKITENSARKIANMSNGYFSITTPPSYLAIVYPNGGESFVKGQKYSITWVKRNLTGNVKIELYKAGKLAKNISSSASSPTETSTYQWTVPNDSSIVPGADYQVKITSTSSTSFNVMSAGYFTISAPSSYKGGSFIGGLLNDIIQLFRPK